MKRKNKSVTITMPSGTPQNSNPVDQALLDAIKKNSEAFIRAMNEKHKTK